ncbi:MAG: hypothetical protein B7Z55_10025, partial [Planctomycetales bacterium 12-60-4]
MKTYLRWLTSVVLIVDAAAVCRGADETDAVPAIRSEVIKSSVDGNEQKIRYFIPENLAEPAPLFVLLHTWSGNVGQDSFVLVCAQECQRLGWVLIHPDFRGANVRPEACASDLAVQDVVDAVQWIESITGIDTRRRYVAGASGGGHMTLIMSGRHKKLWAAASAWVPISDLAAWHSESVARKTNYALHLEQVCGGVPGMSAEVDAQYRHRSPLTHLAHAKGLPLDINAGITDGHNGSVPISHSLRAFNLLAELNGHREVQFSPDEITTMTEQQMISPADREAAPNEPDRAHPVLLRRVAGSARITIFDGGHEGDLVTA